MANEDNVVVVSELADRSDAELRSLGASKAEEFQKAKFKHALGQLDKTHMLRSLRQDIARINTVLRGRAHQGENS